jgi:hypothetical protein
VDEHSVSYPARLDIDYPEQLSRLTTFFRVIWIIPIGIILALISATGNETVVHYSGRVATRSAGGIAGGLWLATLLMLLFRRKYPRWWFDFARELTRFTARVGSYFLLLTDHYPSTTDEQSVHLELDYPDVEMLNPGLPVVKWFLAIPHYFVLAFLWTAAVIVTFFSWIAIIVSGRYPETFFTFVVGVIRWSLRVQAYAFLLITDTYPPFSLQ